jgi:beta-glucanase (GH16 family)
MMTSLVIPGHHPWTLVITLSMLKVYLLIIAGILVLTNCVSSFTLGKCSVGDCMFTEPFEETFKHTRLCRYAAYDGDPSTCDWTDESGDGSYVSILYGDSTYTPNLSSGAIISTTRYLHYGTVAVRVKVARDRYGNPAQGVVTAFSLLSDIGDEIDFEVIGALKDRVFTNYFYNREPIYDVNADVFYNDFDASDYNLWKIRWTPTEIQWFVDDNLVRTLTKSSTWDGSKYKYPSTPSRITIGAWIHTGGWAGTFDPNAAPHVARFDWVWIDPTTA